MNKEIKKFTEELAKELIARVSEPAVKEAIEKTKATKGSGRFKVVVSTDELDRHGEIIDQDGWDLSRYMENPIVLWAHEHWSMPIGVTESISVQTVNGKKALVAEGYFVDASINPLGPQIAAAYEAKVLTKTSVGFIVHEMEGNKITKAELLEFSFVPIPANPGVADLMKAAGLELAEFAAKGIIANVKEGEPTETPSAEPQNQGENTEPAEQPAGQEQAPETENTEQPAADAGAENQPEAPSAESTQGDPAPSEEQKDLGKKDLTPERAGEIMAVMQESISDAMTEAALAIQGELGVGGDGKAVAAPEQKAGRVISSANAKKLRAAKEALTQAIAAVEEVLALAEDEDDEGGKGENLQLEKTAAPDEKVENPQAGSVDLTLKSLDDFLAVRSVLRAVGHATDKALESVNKKIKEGTLQK